MWLSAGDLLTLWMPWPQIILVLAGLCGLYVLGWIRLRQRGGLHTASGWRLASMLLGVGALAVAMLSAIEVLQDMLFSIHMIQHLLIMMLGAPLILLSEPYPILLWGLPVNARKSIVRILMPGARFRVFLTRASSPWLAWGLYVGATWLWHTPAAYDAALRYEVLHVMEHVAYFLFALLFWWQISNAAPRLHGGLSYGRRLGLVFAALSANEVLGVAIAFATTPLYLYYTTVPRLWGISVMDDQALGGP